MTTITTICPYLPTSDVARASRFYIETLGFNVAHQEGDAFALLQLDSAELALSRKQEKFTPSACMLRVTGIEAFYERCKAAGANIVSPLSAKPWGMKMFIVHDTDGNVLDFGEAIK